MPPTFPKCPRLSLQIAVPLSGCLTHPQSWQRPFLQTPRTRTRDHFPETSGVLRSDGRQSPGTCGLEPNHFLGCGEVLCRHLPQSPQLDEGRRHCPAASFPGRQVSPNRSGGTLMAPPPPRPPSGWSHSRCPPCSAGERGSRAPPVRLPSQDQRSRLRSSCGAGWSCPP